MILITGAAKGLGRAIALTLARQGHSVIIHYRKSLREAESVAEECRQLGVEAVIFQGDFSSESTTRDFIERYVTAGFSTKGLVNNVGEYFTRNLEETPQSKWRELFESNLHTPYALISALLPSLKKEKGRIVNIGTSGLHGMRVNAFAPAYQMTKMALYHLTTAFAKELAPDGITVNMVSPGYLENSVDKPPKFPMGRPATLSETAHIVASFFEKESAYITGQNIEVAGGIAL